MLTDKQRRRDLFTNWIHVPLGITSLLFLVWLIKLAMDRAPFRFPSPVLAMLLLFVTLLALDYLSSTSFVRSRSGQREGGRKVLLQPMLVLLEAPCDFCLRYMSVMFTPSFILIPAREIINGKEIGLITGWFAASQILALIFPVLLHKLIRRTVALVKRRYRAPQRKREEEQRRASVATLVAVMSHINGVEPALQGKGRKGRFGGGEKLGSVATGLSGMTAIATVPLTVSRGGWGREDAQRQLEHVQLETARQQGDPYATAHTPLPEHHHHYPLHAAPLSPHIHRLHDTPPPLGRSRSLARSYFSSRVRVGASLSPQRAPRPRSGAGAGAAAGGSTLKNLAMASRRPRSAGTHTKGGSAQNDSLSPTFDEYIFQKRQSLIDGRAQVDASVRSSEDGQADAAGETLVMPTLAPPTPTRASHDNSDAAARRPSKADSELTMSHDITEAQPSPHSRRGSTEKGCSNLKLGKGEVAGDDDGAEKPRVLTVEQPHSNDEEAEEEEMDAVDRLVERLWNAIPWFVFSVVLVAGLPVFYITDISLPLFLGVNLVTFLASITLVPAAVRRYAHPILTTSVATVLVLWALGAARGWSLRRTLASYSVDAKYTVLWSLQGYNGPVIGAGDVLFSTLDAGIVSLAIPMYRYRWDLWLHLADMLAVLFPCSMLSLFVWPTVAARMGIAPERALAFASRFMSTPLAIELSLTIGADESITVVLVVITGILISIFKDPFFRLFRLNPDQDGPPNSNGEKGEAMREEGGQDYLTIGIAMGSTAGAIGASSLIAKPRCMAIASLSFVLFGAILLIFAAIPPIVQTLRTLALAPAVFTPAS